MNQLPQPDPNTVMKITRWVLMAFFAYVLIHSVRDYTAPPQPVAPVAAPVTSEAPRAVDCDKKRFPLLAVMLPQLMMKPDITDVTKGSGDPAFCGQEADVRYVYRDNSNKVIGKGSKHIAIGDGQIARGAEIGMAGMKAGGERKMSIPDVLSYTHDGDIKLLQNMGSKPMSANITLERLSGAYPSSPMPLRSVITRVGGGTEIRCGDIVSANLYLWKTDGTPVFSSDDKPVTFTLGKSEVPYGVEQALMGTREGGEITIIIPPVFAKPLIDNKDSKVLVPGLPDNEVLVARIEVLQVGGPATKQGFNAVLDAAEKHNAGSDTKKNTDKETDKK